MAEKPLKILVLDGGGLQAISTLLILDNLLQAIAKQRGLGDKKPKPCEIFDTIAGIGAGGWLAILLGRFRMDILAAMTEWYHLMRLIAPRSKTEELRMRVRHHCHFDMKTLIDQVDNMTKTYRTGQYLYEPKPKGARTRHVIVAALRQDEKDSYNLFRSYAIPSWAKMPERLLEGSANPREFEISRAFGVTGAARYFSPPWKEQVDHGKGTIRAKFIDTVFPKPHNITCLILNEMWGIYGTNKEISVILNIGPGQPMESDIKTIAKRFSWGLNTLDIDSKAARSLRPWETQAQSGAFLSRSAGSKDRDERQQNAHISFEDSQTPVESGLNSSRFQQDISPKICTRTTFGSIKDEKAHRRRKQLESEIEEKIKQKLDAFYPSSPQLYFRLAIDQAPEGSPQNDSKASGLILDKTLDYLSEDSTESTINTVVDRVSDNESQA